MKKRWLGILLTICMVLTLLPTAAWAEGETGTGTVAEVGSKTDLKAAIETGSAPTVKLTANIEIKESLTVSRTVTLDLNDHVLTLTGENRFITVSGPDTTLTLTDSAETKTERKFSINQDGAWVLDANGDQTVTGGVITGGKTGADLYGTPEVNSGVCIKNHGTLTVTNVTVNAPVLNIRGAIAGSGTFNGTVVNEDRITGGTFNGPVANYKGREDGDNAISGGIFYGTVANGYNYIDPDKGELALDRKSSGLISGGTFYGKVTNAFYSTISGGSFYGEVDNRDRSGVSYTYRGSLEGGTFYGVLTGTAADGCCTVTYDYGALGGTYATQIVQKDGKAIQPTDPKVNGFTFLGWYTDEACADESKYNFETTVTRNITLYGKWEGTYYGIRITDKDGNVVYVTDKNADDVLDDGTVVYTPGYFKKDEIPEVWLDNGSLTKEALLRLLDGAKIPGVQIPKLTLSDATLQGIEGRSLPLGMIQLDLLGENTVSCADDGVDAIYASRLFITGSGSLSATATGQKAAAIAVESEGGIYYQYGGDVTLNGAYSGIYCSGAYFEFAAGKLTASSSNSALYCSLNDSHFKITSDTTTFFCGTSQENAFKIQQPFDYANVGEQLKTNNCSFVPLPDYGYQTILYAQLTSNHTVIFNTDGGSTVEPVTVPYGETAKAPAAPTKSGYTFDGWYLGNEKYNFNTPVTADLTLTAHWTRNSSGGGGGTTTYTLTFDTNGGSALSALRLARGSTVDLARYVPERSGHVFTGWYADAALTQPIETLTLSASTTVYAGWRAETGDLPFTDVGADAWYRDDVQYVYDKGLMTGTTADRFAPNGSMTRAMLVTVLWRQAGSPVVNYAMDFSDVAEGAWYAEAVRWAAAEGVVGGYGDGRFGPDDPITREQLATILFRHLVGDGAAELADWLRPYADADQIGSYAVPAMQWAVGHGVLKGDGDRLDPQGTATRAQVAAVLHRALEL